MTRRLQKMTITVAALASLALGGAAFAQAQTSASSAPERVSASDRDNVRSGNQTAPDKARSASADPAGGGTGQSGDQSAPDAVAGDTESAPANDGPGGHADEPGNATADHQFQGNE